MNGSARYVPELPVSLAEGWSVERLTPPSRLYGANGIRTGKDGRIYVAQVCGSQVSALDIDDGSIATISPTGGGIVGPDDLAFDESGTIYCTEITTNRVSALHPDGTTQVLNDSIIVANPITFHAGRLIVGELRPGGRIMELDRNTGDARLILGDVPMPNAFEVGLDGKLYFPVMGTNEIWRVCLDGGPHEVVAGDLGTPDSVKFDAEGFIVSTQIGTGQVLRIDPRTGAKTVLADLAPGLDNCTFVGGRLFVSHIGGAIFEVYGDGTSRTAVAGGMQFPMGIAVAESGTVYVADAMLAHRIEPGRPIEEVGSTVVPGFPGSVRGVAADGPGNWILTTTRGDVARWAPGRAAEFIASGFTLLMGVAVGPDGSVVFADYATGRVLRLENGAVSEEVTGLDRPTGIAVAPDGTVFVGEAGAGRVCAIVRGKAETILDGLREPHGIAIHHGKLFTLDVAAKQVIECDLSGAGRKVIAGRLPVGAPPGIVQTPLGGFGDMAGPLIALAGLAAGPDDALYIAADAEGSVIKLCADPAG